MRGGWLAAAATVVIVGLSGCATLFNRITTRVTPESGAAGEPQLRLSCLDSSSGKCYFRYLDVATDARVEYVVEQGQQALVPDISAPARLCIATSSVGSLCLTGTHHVGPRGGISFNAKY